MIVAGIPAYNEEKTIARVVLLAQKYVDVVVVCDDGSQDLTADIAQKLGAIVIKHEENLGYGAAVQSLFAKTRTLNADLLLTLDADGQHNAGEIPRLLQPILESKADIVVGSRFLQQSSELPLYRRWGIKILTKMADGSGGKGKLSDSQCGFRAYNRRAIEDLDLCEPGMGVSVEILRQARSRGMTIAEVPVETRYHDLDTSTQDPVGHGMSIFLTIIEERPLVYLGVPAMLAFIVGIAVGVGTLYLYLYEYHYTVVNLLLISVALILFGMFTFFTAITLSTLPSLAAVLSKDASTPNPVSRGVSLLSRIIKLVVEENPLVNLGLPAMFALLAGIGFGVETLYLYAVYHYMITSYLLISVALVFFGMFALFTAITLFAINKAKRRMRVSLEQMQRKT
jgi:glycosyltransferase involved in cell wall biosynthesis